jgi:gamma-glutamyl-gamma-aminobutyrate hydrolase PuuD
MYLMASEYSPIHGYGDEPVLIGPFESKERLEQFLERHDRVFRTGGEVYSPDEYDKAVEAKEQEDGYTPPGDGPLQYTPVA